MTVTVAVLFYYGSIHFSLVRAYYAQESAGHDGPVLEYLVLSKLSPWWTPTTSPPPSNHILHSKENLGYVHVCLFGPSFAEDLSPDKTNPHPASGLFLLPQQ